MDYFVYRCNDLNTGWWTETKLSGISGLFPLSNQRLEFDIKFDSLLWSVFFEVHGYKDIFIYV